MNEAKPGNDEQVSAAEGGHGDAGPSNERTSDQSYRENDGKPEDEAFRADGTASEVRPSTEQLKTRGEDHNDDVNEDRCEDKEITRTNDSVDFEDATTTRAGGNQDSRDEAKSEDDSHKQSTASTTGSLSPIQLDMVILSDVEASADDDDPVWLPNPQDDFQSGLGSSEAASPAPLRTSALGPSRPPPPHVHVVQQHNRDDAECSSATPEQQHETKSNPQQTSLDLSDADRSIWTVRFDNLPQRVLTEPAEKEMMAQMSRTQKRLLRKQRRKMGPGLKWECRTGSLGKI